MQHHECFGKFTTLKSKDIDKENQIILISYTNCFCSLPSSKLEI